MRHVRLLSVQYVYDKGAGRIVTKYPGEWVKVGNQQATAWLATGQADRPDMPDLQAMPGCGVVLPPGVRPSGVSGLVVKHADEPCLEYARTLIWSGVNFRGDLLAVGFMLLDTWEVAVPILSYTQLARDVGSAEDRDRTKRTARDLRVPVYDVRLLFLKRCQATRRLMDVWREEPGDRSLAFLRALYQVKPLICALPTTWVLA